MTILSVAGEVCLEIGIEVPTSFVTNTDREYTELMNVAKESATDIFRAHDWQILQAISTFTGDGSTEAFDLPTGYDRMVEGSRIWSSQWTWQLTKITTTDEWLEYLVTPYTFVTGAWIIYGGQFHFLPVMPSAATAKFFYMSNLIVAPASGSNKTSFTVDTDTFRLSERLLKLNMIWRWKQMKRQDYADRLQDYQVALLEEMRLDRGASDVVRTGNSSLSRRVKPAFIQTVGGTP